MRVNSDPHGNERATSLRLTELGLALAPAPWPGFVVYLQALHMYLLVLRLID